MRGAQADLSILAYARMHTHPHSLILIHTHPHSFTLVQVPCMYPPYLTCFFQAMIASIEEQLDDDGEDNTASSQGGTLSAQNEAERSRAIVQKLTAKNAERQQQVCIHTHTRASRTQHCQLTRHIFCTNRIRAVERNFANPCC